MEVDQAGTSFGVVSKYRGVSTYCAILQYNMYEKEGNGIEVLPLQTNLEPFLCKMIGLQFVAKFQCANFPIQVVSILKPSKYFH